MYKYNNELIKLYYYNELIEWYYNGISTLDDESIRKLIILSTRYPANDESQCIRSFDSDMCHFFGIHMSPPGFNPEQDTIEPNILDKFLKSLLRIICYPYNLYISRREQKEKRKQTEYWESKVNRELEEAHRELLENDEWKEEAEIEYKKIEGVFYTETAKKLLEDLYTGRIHLRILNEISSLSSDIRDRIFKILKSHPKSTRYVLEIINILAPVLADKFSGIPGVTIVACIIIYVRLGILDNIIK